MCYKIGARILIGFGLCFLFNHAVLAQSDLGPKTRVRPIELIVQTAGANLAAFETVRMIAEEWRKLGLNVKVNPMEWARISQKVFKQRNYDTAAVRYSGRSERIDPYHFIYHILHSEGLGNESGYRSKEYDYYAGLQNKLMDVSKRRHAVFRAQEISAHDQPITPIINRSRIQVYNHQTFEGYKSMMGEGLNSFWNFISLRPKTNRTMAHYAYAEDLTTLNPTVMNIYCDFAMAQLYYDRLVRIDLKGVPQNWAAETIEMTDPLTCRVKLRSGMTFHDGKPVTAEDVKFSFELIKKVKTGRLWKLAKVADEVRILDDLTVEFKTKEPYAPFIANSLCQIFILPKHVWGKIPLKEVSDFPNLQAIGSGPFKLEYWERGRETKFVRHNNHFSKPAIDGFFRIPFASVDGIVGALEKGEIDFTGWWLDPPDAEPLGALPHIKIIEVANHGIFAIDYNNRVEPFNNVPFRRALAYAVPKERIKKLIFEGHGTLAFSTIGSENEFWHNPNTEKVMYDLGRAKAILLGAGYRFDAKGKLHYPKQ